MHFMNCIQPDGIELFARKCFFTCKSKVASTDPEPCADKRAFTDSGCPLIDSTRAMVFSRSLQLMLYSYLWALRGKPFDDRNCQPLRIFPKLRQILIIQPLVTLTLAYPRHEHGAAASKTKLVQCSQALSHHQHICASCYVRDELQTMESAERLDRLALPVRTLLRHLKDFELTFTYDFLFKSKPSKSFKCPS